DRTKRWFRPPAPAGEPARLPGGAGGPGAGTDNGRALVPPWSAPDRAANEDEPEDAALEVRDLEVRFGGFVALTGVNITVKPGSLHAIVGPNGAGKTTLLNTVSGQYRPSRGSVWVAGERIDILSPRDIRRRGVVRTFQTPTVVSDLDVIDNVKLGLDADDESWLLADLMGGIATGRRERIREG